MWSGSDHVGQSPQDEHEQIEAFYQAAYNNPKAVALREELRPLIREQLHYNDNSPQGLL
jgi:hypothetical protein